MCNRQICTPRCISLYAVHIEHGQQNHAKYRLSGDCSSRSYGWVCSSSTCQPWDEPPPPGLAGFLLNSRVYFWALRCRVLLQCSRGFIDTLDVGVLGCSGYLYVFLGNQIFLLIYYQVGQRKRRSGFWVARKVFEFGRWISSSGDIMPWEVPRKAHTPFVGMPPIGAWKFHGILR